MIGLFSNEKYIPKNNINIKNIDRNIIKIKQINNSLCKYVTKLYFEYYEIIHTDNIEEISSELKDKYKDNITNIKNNINDINKYDLIISPSHSDTYHIIKQLKKDSDEKLLVICFDMHCDTYNHEYKLWKGNVFSKLLEESIISDFIVVGVPKYKIKNTLRDVPADIKKNVNIKRHLSFKKDIKKIKPTRVFISIDIDCLDTRKKKYSALEYCPMTILSNLSNIKLENLSNEQIIKEVKNCIFVKNELGYANLYKTGENKMNVNKLIKSVNKIKKYCHKKGIILGYDNMYFDITEVSGYDYDSRTSEGISKLIDKLI